MSPFLRKMSIIYPLAACSAKANKSVIMLSYTRTERQREPERGRQRQGPLKFIVTLQNPFWSVTICDGLRVPAASPPGRLATVVKPGRAWIPMLRRSTTCLMYCKWRPMGQPFDST